MVKRKRAYATYILALIFVGVFVAERLVQISSPDGRHAGVQAAVNTLLMLGGLNKALVFQSGQWFRLVTSLFLHLDLVHLIGNVVLLLLIGRYLEPLIGRGWFLTTFLLSGISAAFGSLILNSTLVTSVGSSGAILGLVACALPCGLLSNGRRRWRVQAWLLLALILSFVPAPKVPDGQVVDFGNHIGGIVGGLAIGFLLLLGGSRSNSPQPWPGFGRGLALCLTMVYGTAAAFGLDNAWKTLPAYWGEVSMARLDYDRAITHFSEALRRKPSAAVYFDRGLAWKAMRRHAEAIADFEKAVEADPQLIQARLALGWMYSDSEDNRRALEQANEIIAIHADSSDGYALRGIAHQRLGKTQQALEDFAQALKLNPNDAYNYNNRAMTLLSLGQFHRALSDVSIALKLKPNDTAILDTRGQILVGLDQPKEAIADFDVVLRTRPNPSSFFGRGSAYEKLGSIDLAIQDYTVALSTAASDGDDREAQRKARSRLKELKAAAGG